MRARYLCFAAGVALFSSACGSDASTAPSSLDAGLREADAASQADAASDADGGRGITDGLLEAGTRVNVPLPMPNGKLDYQLGGAYPPPAMVTIISRDRSDAPAPQLYNICYVNGFQTQPDEKEFWRTKHAQLVLRDSAGKEVIDPKWPDELLLDTSTAQSRTALLAIVAPWIDDCKQAGFDAIEFDNLDSYSRSRGRLTEEHALLYMRMLADAAHARGLAVAQKNASELLLRRAQMDTDFAIVEDCNDTGECAEYVAVYGEHVFLIEYERAAFERGCRDYPNLSIVYRDVELVTPAERDYSYEGC